MELLSTKEEVALQKFRERCADIGQDDEVLIRFLRARNLHLQKAEDMLRKHMEYRENHLQGIMDYRPPDIIRENLSFDFIGQDNEGDPVLLVPIGRWEVRKLLEKGFKQESFRHTAQLLEIVMMKLKELKRKEFSVILDSAELTFTKLASLQTVESIVLMFNIFEANYPETLKDCYIINAPWIFSYIFGIVKPILSAKTLSKVQIFDSKRETWGQALGNKMPRESLPRNYGGLGPEFKHFEGVI